MEEIIKMFQEGKSIRHIHKVTNIHRGKISKILKSYGVETSFGCDQKLLVDSYQHGESIENIAKKFNLCNRRVVTILNKHGIFFYKEKRELTDDEKTLVLSEYINGKSLKDISLDISCGVKTLCDFLRPQFDDDLLSLSHRKNKILKISDKEIEIMYKEGKTLQQISDECEAAIPIIRRKIIKNKTDIRFKNKKYEVNDNYLDNIDSHEKAYFLGFFYGDGHHNAKKSEMMIAIQSKDRIVVDSFAEELGSTRPMRLIPPNREGWQEKIHMSFSSPRISERLTSFGCNQNKTHDLKFPNYIPDKFLNSFILGMFDSDGSIWVTNKNSYGFCICGTLEICQGIAKFFKEVDIDIHIYPHKSGIFYARTSKQTSIEKIGEIMYKDCKIWLPRKKALFNSLNLKMVLKKKSH